MSRRDPIFDNLENLQEEVVLTTLKRQLAGPLELPDLCRCHTCYVDMVALALNAVPPRYVADRFNKFGETLEDEARAIGQVEGAVRLAIGRVAARKHH